MKKCWMVVAFGMFAIGNCLSQVETQLQPSIVGQSGSAAGQQITIEFPGYLSLTHGDGTGSKSCPNPLGGINCQGIWTIYDLKNDPKKTYRWAAQDSGLSQHQWNGVKNADGSERWSEVKEGGQSCTITETNNVRTLLTCTGPIYRYGNKVGFPDPDCCVKLSKTYAFYRHGGTETGSRGLKIYTTTTLLYDGNDKKGPLKLTNNNLYTDFMWALVSGEDVVSDHTRPPDCGHFAVLTPSPLNLQYQNPGKQGVRDYNLLTPTPANSSQPGEFIPTNGCAQSSGHGMPGPLGTPGQPPAGTVFRCNGATSIGCASQTSLGQILHVNILQISREPVGYMNLTGNPPAVFFIGGIRFQNFLPPTTLTPGQPATWSSLFYVGDNGVTTTKAADTLTVEYKSSPKLEIKNGSGARFDSLQGYWEVTESGAGGLSISAEGDLHSPAFLIAPWNGPIPSKLAVGGASRKLNADFVAVKLPGNRLLLQLLFDVKKRSTISLSGE